MSPLRIYEEARVRTKGGWQVITHVELYHSGLLIGTLKDREVEKVFAPNSYSHIESNNE